MEIFYVGQMFQKIKQVKEHSHNGYEIIVIKDGETMIYLDQKEHDVKKGNVIIIPPGTVHSNLSSGGFTDLYVVVDRMSIRPNSPVIFFDNTGVIFSLMNILYTTWIQKDYNYKSLSTTLMTAIDEYIIQLQGRICKYDFVQALKDFITQEFSNPNFDLATQADHLGVSKEYLRHCFKEDMGIPPLEYLTDLRIEQAKFLLVQGSNMTVHEIAQNCGFNDPYYFSRCFRKKTGLSPRDYRNRESETYAP